MSKEIFMDDVNSMGLEALKLIERRLAEFNIRLTDEQEDSIYVPLVTKLEELAGCPDYRCHN